jgi:TPR repeat protein
MAHELGRGAPVDLTVAFAHYLKSGQDGFAPAQFNVGNM